MTLESKKFTKNTPGLFNNNNLTYLILPLNKNSVINNRKSPPINQSNTSLMDSLLTLKRSLNFFFIYGSPII